MAGFIGQLRFVALACAILILPAGSMTVPPPQASPTPTSKAQPKPPRPKAAPEVTAAELRPVKTHVGQTCPAHLTFYGSITTNGATTVQYTFASSDGRSWPTRTMKFAAAGTKSVSQPWKLGQPGKKVNKWLQLQTVSPNRVKSSEAPVTLDCAK